MQILTPLGYRNINDCSVGDEVVAFDIATGAPILNHIEEITPVDETTFESWQNPRYKINGSKKEYFGLHSFKNVVPKVPHADGQYKTIKQFRVGDGLLDLDGKVIKIKSIKRIDDVPEFVAYRINGKWTLFAEQSIWTGPGKISHARNLKVGETIYDDADQPITITSIEGLKSGLWYKLAISGDHSFISDGLTLHNASRFWVGGTGTWDAADTTHWASSSGGAGGQTVPGSGDTVTLDGSSGGGTVTVNTAVTVQSITMSAFTGTLDFAANDNNVTIGSWVNTGTATRGLNMGDGAWTVTGATGTVWQQATTTNLSFAANGSTLTFSATPTSQRAFLFGAVHYNNVHINNAVAVAYDHTTVNGGAWFIDGTLTFTNVKHFTITGGVIHTITGAWTWTCSAAAPGILISNAAAATISVGAANTLTGLVVGAITKSGAGSITVNDGYDLGNNTSVTINAPAGGGLLTHPGMNGRLAA